MSPAIQLGCTSDFPLLQAGQAGSVKLWSSARRFAPPFVDLVLVRGPPPAPVSPGPFRVGGSVLAGGLTFPFLSLFQVHRTPFAPASAAALHASGVTHAALRDVAMLARLAGKEALQAKRFGLITADDVWGGDS
jgi:hypothetical protein